MSLLRILLLWSLSFFGHHAEDDRAAAAPPLSEVAPAPVEPASIEPSPISNGF